MSLASISPLALALLRIVAGLLFLEHGLIKLIGFPEFELFKQIGLDGAKIAPGMVAFSTDAIMHWTRDGQLWVGAVIETATGILLILGLFTRFAAFIAAGEMAVAYWQVHFTRGMWPAGNGGDAAILFCFIFFYLIFAGAGALSLDGSGKK
jgi:putative oxidoreductase